MIFNCSASKIKVFGYLNGACSGSEVSIYLHKNYVLIRTTVTTELFYGQTFCTLTVLPTELKRDMVKFAVNLLCSALTECRTLTDVHIGRPFIEGRFCQIGEAAGLVVVYALCSTISGRQNLVFSLTAVRADEVLIKTT